jgi:enamine deaminase RidA (YjgF/YER057c/UK114 family)
MTTDEPVDWHKVIGFERSHGRGPFLLVSGSGPYDEDGHLVGSDTYEQTHAALASLRRTLLAADADFGDLMGTRIFLRNASDWQDAGRAHGEVLGEYHLALTMVQAAPVDPAMLVEIEAIAWRSPEGTE